MKSIFKLLLRLVQFVCFDIWPVLYTSVYKSSEVGYWKLMGNDEPCLEWVTCMPGTTVQEYQVLSRNVSLGNETYYIPVGLNIRLNRNSVTTPQRSIPRGIRHTRQAGRGVVIPVHPTEAPGGLQVESQELAVQHLYGHHKHRSYIDTYQFPPSRCKLFNYCKLSNDNVQYPWLSYYEGQQEYNIRSIMSGVSLFQGFKYTGVQEHRSTKYLVTL